jgi:preprotein translocase subunit SecY
MKRTIILFVICALLLVTMTFWAWKGLIAGNMPEILMVSGVLLIIGFALFIGSTRIRSHLRKEPSEDELSKGIMTKATSLAYYISLYLWLFIMSISDKISLPAHTQIGAGILGMALAFFFCWLWVKATGMKND